MQDTRPEIDIDIDNAGEALKKPLEKRKKSHIFQAVLGLVIISLAITGVVYIVSDVKDIIVKKMNDDTQLRKFDEFLLPAVMMDPQPFASIDKAETAFILQASIWKSLMDDEKISTYEMVDDRYKIPLSEIEANAKSLFGDIKLTFESVGEAEEMFEYSPDDECFYIPLFPIQAFEPYVLTAKKKNDIYTLEVGYLSSSDVDKVDETGQRIAPEPAKTMKYTVKAVASGYEIMSVDIWQ